MKAQYSIKIEGFETKVDGMPIKLGNVSIECSGEHGWFDVLCFTRIFKQIPKWVADLYKEVAKMEQN